MLEVACGTGVPSRAAADQREEGGSVVGLNMKPGVFSVAEELSPELE